MDALWSIYYKCQAQGAMLSDSRVFPPSDWNLFNRRVCGPAVAIAKSSSPRFTISKNNMSMLYVNGTTGAATFDVGDPRSPLAPFFASTPTTYTSYGRYPASAGISYDFAGTGLDILFNECSSWLTSATVSSSTAASFLDARYDGGRRNNKPKTRGQSKAVATQIDAMQRMYAHARKYVKSDRKAREYVEMMMCVHRNECLGGVFDYAATFKRSFKLHLSPYCYDVLEDIATGERTIPVPGWARLLMDTYGCTHIQQDTPYQDRSRRY
ncbi:hypothetical protein B5M09_010778 [Aphanomyces astaci]|uniref:Uncharacterized protein n=1 Tax=Aphanomyces astaci TaxID=112090 RepID=A0A3R7ZAE8_APHAT|nr:hypothetical protein B5M09_010778 [Aphanomyces astaci]